MKKLFVLTLIFLTLASTSAQAKISFGSTIRSGCQPVNPADPDNEGK